LYRKADFSSDPFIHMERANKTYGWVIAVKELRETVPNLFRYVSGWKRKNNIKSQGLWEVFVSKTEKKEKLWPEEKDGPGTVAKEGIDPEAMEGESYNMCHFWSNFEIARFDFFRSQQYEDLFQTLEQSGGFWQERVCPYKSWALIQSMKANSVFDIVGRRTSTFVSGRCSFRQEGCTLLPRYWISTHHNSALPQ